MNSLVVICAFATLLVYAEAARTSQTTRSQMGNMDPMRVAQQMMSQIPPGMNPMSQMPGGMNPMSQIPGGMNPMSQMPGGMNPMSRGRTSLFGSNNNGKGGPGGH